MKDIIRRFTYLATVAKSKRRSSFHNGKNLRIKLNEEQVTITGKRHSLALHLKTGRLSLGKIHLNGTLRFNPKTDYMTVGTDFYMARPIMAAITAIERELGCDDSQWITMLRDF